MDEWDNSKKSVLKVEPSEAQKFLRTCFVKVEPLLMEALRVAHRLRAQVVIEELPMNFRRKWL